MARWRKTGLFAVSFFAIAIADAGAGDSPSAVAAQSPEQEVQQMLEELCDIAGKEQAGRVKNSA